jgi:prepilin-type N-terminal cleavage/methylation domain-containing protein/prepilin-type processing-associated H-X9-DG protein
MNFGRARRPGRDPARCTFAPNAIAGSRPGLHRGQTPGHGFTLVELLVVIIIIGMLAGLAVPALLSARERARTALCADNLRNLGHAVIQFETSQGAYPGFANRVPGSYTSEASWPVMLLKTIGREDLWNQFREGTQATARVGLFICPSDSDAGAEGPALSYVANCGQRDEGPNTVQVQGKPERLGDYANNIPPDWQGNGIFFRHYSSDQTANPTTFSGLVKVTLSSEDVKDGTRHTFVLSELQNADEWNCDCPEEEKCMGFQWCQDIAADVVVGINSEARPMIPAPVNEPLPVPSSYHPRGVNTVYCDGHVKFLSDQVSYQVYALQMTPNGSAVWKPGVAKSVASGKPPAWCRQPLPTEE